MASKGFGPIELLFTTSQLKASRYEWRTLRETVIRSLLDDLHCQMEDWADAAWSERNGVHWQEIAPGVHIDERGVARRPI